MTRTRTLFALLILGTIALPLEAISQGRAASVFVETVEVRSLSDTAPVIGQLVASTQANVASRRSGIAAEVLFEVGDKVEAGEPLVRLDTALTEIEQRTLNADLAVARAGIATAEARVARAQQALARQDRLKGSTAFSKGIFEDLEQSVQEARGQLSEAIAEVSAAEARLTRVDYQLEHAVIRAPFTGVVVERMAQPGQFVSLGQAVAKFLDFDALEIEADVPVELIRSLPKGTDVGARLADGVLTTSRVRAVLPIETVSTRTRPVRFVVDLNELDPQLLAVGKSVTLQIPVSAPREVVTVPKDALVQNSDGEWTVFVVAEEKAQPRTIVLGQAAGERMEVIEGLAAGELVVVRGNERLRPGQAVSATPAGG